MRKTLYLFLALFLFGIFSSINVLAVTTLSTSSVCCEKTTSGGICINTQPQNCDNSFSVVPTSCDSTSFCKLGTCYDSTQGMCLENVPQQVCQAQNGTWSDKPADQLSVCQLGCCIIGDQASFVTLTRCKSLSTFYGVNITYDPSITSEFQCIEKANSQDQGACVFYDGNVKTCKFTTRGDCGGTESVLNVSSSPLDQFSGKLFYKGVLCSAEELGTDCARQTSTTCSNGMVYWVDSCSNKENVYSSDSSKSWNNGRVANPDDVCAPTGTSTTCGNCDYLQGSRCSTWENSLLSFGKPANVNNYCKATSCTDRSGKTRLNGESWCVYDSPTGNGQDPAGSRQYREICTDGKVQVEACEDFRNQICVHSGIQTSAGEYSVAACKVNRWQDCTQQNTKDTCQNTDQRDCLWVAAVDGVNFTITPTQQGQAFSNPSTSFSNPIGGNQSTSSTNTQNALSTVSAVSGAAQTFSGGTGAVIFPTTITGNVINNIIGAGVGQWEQNSLNNNLRTNQTSNDSGLCVPMVSPGQKFWEQGDAQAICSQASATCQVTVTRTYKKDILTGEKKLDSVSISNTSCLTIVDKNKGTFKVNPQWAAQVNAVCSALGDCGAGENINGVFTDDGYTWTYKNQSYFFTQGDLGLLTSTQLGKGTGEAIKLDYIINDKYQLNENDEVYVKA